MADTTAKKTLDTNGLIGTIEKLGEATEEELVASFGRQGARAILVMTNNLNVAKEDLEAMANSVGATEQAFAKMTKTFDFQANVLKQNWNAVLIEAGTKVLPMVNASLQILVALLEDVS